MPVIKPVSDLRSYGEVLACVAPGSPVFLTKNGSGRYAILDMDDYDKLVASGLLLGQLEQGRFSGERDGWVSSDSAQAHVASRSTT